MKISRHSFLIAHGDFDSFLFVLPIDATSKRILSSFLVGVNFVFNYRKKRDFAFEPIALTQGVVVVGPNKMVF